MADFIQEQGSTASYEGNQYVELAGTSQEAKPTGDFLSGSVFVEVDTGKVFLYDRGSSEWHEIAGSGGGGGGGGLPPYTNADLGKSLALVNSSETTTIIQSQSVECVPTEYECIGHLAEGTYDFSSLAAGDTVALTVDGVTENVEAELGPGSSLFLPGTDFAVFCDTGEVFLSSGESTVTVTISAVTETARAVPSWRGPLIVHRLEGSAKATPVIRLDKTWKEIYDAFLAGGVVVTYSVNDDPIYVSVYSVWVNNGNYMVGVSTPAGNVTVLYSTTSENGYPRASN